MRPVLRVVLEYVGFANRSIDVVEGVDHYLSPYLDTSLGGASGERVSQAVKQSLMHPFARTITQFCLPYHRVVMGTWIST
jgi:hypothetical protein